MSTEPTNAPTRATHAHGSPAAAASRNAVNTASLATKPSSGGRPAIDAAATIAIVAIDGHPPPESREPAPVARAGRMVDDADHEEERRLEQGVREQQGDARERRVTGAEPGDEHEEAELADGAVGEQQLEVVLAKGAPAADEHGEHAERDDDRMPHRRGRRSRGRAAPRGRHRPSPSRRRAGRRTPASARPSRRAARSGTARARSSRSRRPARGRCPTRRRRP